MKKREKPKHLAARWGVGVAIFAGSLGAAAATVAVPQTAEAGKLEVLQDGCSADVSFTRPGAKSALEKGARVFAHKRGETTGWSKAFRVETDADGYIHWSCHSTKGNAFDPGTWRITEARVEAVCVDGGCGAKGNVKIGSSAVNGWTPERSRCDSRTNKIRVKFTDDLGGRRMLIQCLPKK